MIGIAETPEALANLLNMPAARMLAVAISLASLTGFTRKVKA
jgi:hypothetical protein